SMIHSDTLERPASGRTEAEIVSALHRARALAERSGARFTRIREHVYRALLRAPQPVGAYDILDTLDGVGAQKPPTVYRALDWLMEMGLAHRIATVSKFVAVPDDRADRPVAYLLCRQCGEARTLDAAPLAASLTLAVRDTGFRKDDAVIEITGLCDGHARAAAR
ncbi:MAG: transcriptional repressor, partial [Litorimonas sp.]